MRWSFGLLGAAGSAAKAFDLIETINLSSSTASVTFNNLNTYSDYKHLQVRMVLRTDRAASTDEMALRFNNDATSSYSKHRLGSNGSSVSVRSLTSQTQIELEFASGNTHTSNSFASGILDILDFSNSSKNTTIKYLGGLSGTANWVGLQSGLYFKTDPITSITIDQISGPNFISGSRFSLYGIRG